ncbi:MAG: hypothetical protein LUH05_10260 [Candidatus Gastranaerophilales bacterium]|nr:hypothetical protein [Candidatus Gastranaerophilales bacterium]
MKILIAGSDLNTILLAKYIKLQNPKSDIYITTEVQEEFYTSVNIKENDINSLCSFVKYNQIEFTIVMSQLAIINGIADLFKKEGFPVFAPSPEAARITFFNSIAKKIMYKLKINTPKFGIFDRENIAVDYVRHSKFPIVIENDFTLLSRENNIYMTFPKAKTALQKIFENNNEKIVIENYIDSEPLYIYFITDGFNALPLITVEKSKEKNFEETIAPSQKLPENVIISILRNVIYPLLDDISKYADGYTGIIGLKVKLKNSNYFVLEFYNSFQNYDLQIFLSLLEENILNLFFDAANGSLADNYNCIHLNNQFGYTVVIDKKEFINEDTESEFIESENNIKSLMARAGWSLKFA